VSSSEQWWSTARFHRLRRSGTITFHKHLSRVGARRNHHSTGHGGTCMQRRCLTTTLFVWPTDTHTHTTILQLSWTMSGTTRVSWYQKVHLAIFWIFWCKTKITQADTPTIRMDCHPIQTNWCPHLCHPHHFYVGCPSWHNPPNLSWLGTGTKYAGLHARGSFFAHRHLLNSL